MKKNFNIPDCVFAEVILCSDRIREYLNRCREEVVLEERFDFSDILEIIFSEQGSKNAENLDSCR